MKLHRFAVQIEVVVEATDEAGAELIARDIVSHSLDNNLAVSEWEVRDATQHIEDVNCPGCPGYVE